MMTVTKDSTTMTTSNRNRSKKNKFKPKTRKLKSLSPSKRRKSAGKTQVYLLIIQKNRISRGKKNNSI